MLKKNASEVSPKQKAWSTNQWHCSAQQHMTPTLSLHKGFTWAGQLRDLRLASLHPTLCAKQLPSLQQDKDLSAYTQIWNCWGVNNWLDTLATRDCKSWCHGTEQVLIWMVTIWKSNAVLYVCFVCFHISNFFLPTSQRLSSK